MIQLFTKDDTGPVISGGQSFYGGTQPVLKYPVSGGDPGGGPNIAPTVPGTPTTPQPKPCGDCGGITSIPLPPPIITPSTGGTGSTGGTTPQSTNQTKPTYNQLANDASAAVTDLFTGDNMQADWWKYLVGAAVGYFLAKK